MKPKVVIILNTAWNLVNFRAGLIRALINRGYEVVAIAPADKYVPRVLELGCQFIALPIDNKGTHPGRDFLLFWRLKGLLRQQRPAMVLGYTVKPNVYASLAAHALDIPVINNIAGLGIVFGKRGWLNKIVRMLYVLALSRSKKVFFQNEEDRNMFIADGLVQREVTDRLPGSGIDLAKFSGTPRCAAIESSELRFLLVARMLWDKGVGDFVNAARIIKSRNPNIEFCLLGFLDVKNPGAISRAQMDQWVKEGAVNYLGVSDDIRTELQKADCIVLPSFYREGVPRSLLEAAAMSKPIITTNSVGCRDVVDDTVNGYLCRPQDVQDLAEKIEKMIRLSPAQRTEMGFRGRQKVEKEFDERIVIQKYIDTIDRILDRNTSIVPPVGALS